MVEISLSMYRQPTRTCIYAWDRSFINFLHVKFACQRWRFVVLQQLAASLTLVNNSIGRPCRADVAVVWRNQLNVLCYFRNEVIQRGTLGWGEGKGEGAESRRRRKIATASTCLTLYIVTFRTILQYGFWQRIEIGHLHSTLLSSTSQVEMLHCLHYSL